MPAFTFLIIGSVAGFSQCYTMHARAEGVLLPCSTGWLSHWGEVMANTSAQFVLQTLSDILSYKNGTGSVNFYMAHGGSNFGYWAGA